MTFARSARGPEATYGPALAAIYDETVATAAMPALVAGIGHAFARFGIRPQSVADVGCGTGWLLATLAAPGRRLYGVDSAPAMLARAARRLRGMRTRGARLALLRQDLRGLALPEQVDLILCTFATLNYLSESDLGRAFGAFRRNLRPGGWLIVDFIARARSAQGPTLRSRQVVEAGGRRSLWTHAVDPARGRTLTRILLMGTRREPAAVERHVQQWHRAATVKTLLARHGFRALSCRPLGAGGPSHWTQMVARVSRRRGTPSGSLTGGVT